MSEKRRDNKKRILRTGESQRQDGRYAYKYIDIKGKTRFIYSWRLEETDKLPKGKRPCEALRIAEKHIQQETDKGLIPDGDGLTVVELVERYASQKVGVKTKTKLAYEWAIRYLEKDDFGYVKISKIKQSDAKEFCMKLQNEGKKSSTVKSFKGVLKPAFQMAIDDDLLLKNPFCFKTNTIIVNNSQKRVALTDDQEKRFMDYIKNSRFSIHYDAIYILLHTGMRISEFCGLTFKDIDLTEKTIDINHQLLRKPNSGPYGGAYVEATKSKSGTRILPMTDDVVVCFKNLLKNRPSPKIEPMVNGKTGFINLNRKGKPTTAVDWQQYFVRIVRSYNKSHTVQLPQITPHICRHTYCSRQARSGMSPKALQYLMGHSSISITLNTYTHLSLENIAEEVARCQNFS
ncbi:MAG: site-specific integrase [Clostridiales bacterium]|nr:site-specific integrase [Clostridiales bacterium]